MQGRLAFDAQPPAGPLPVLQTFRAKSRSPGVSGSQKGMGDCLTAFDAPASFCSSNFAVFHRAKYSMFEEFASRSRPFDGWVFSEVALFLNSRCSLIATLVSKNASRLTVTVMDTLGGSLGEAH